MWGMCAFLTPKNGLASLLTDNPSYNALAELTRPRGGSTLLTSELFAPQTNALAPTPPLSFFNALAANYQPPPTLSWHYVRSRFSTFLANITVTPQQHRDGYSQQAGVRSCLNRNYWGYSSETANSHLIGSWGKDIRVRPPRDVDIIFLLPNDVYWRFHNRLGNRQSQILQEVKNVLAETYPRTDVKGDGQVVVVPFANTPIEVAPGFLCDDGTIIVCDANNGGRYTISTARAEIQELIASDALYTGNTRALVRMMKQWQREKNVPIKSFKIERMAVHFMQQWEHHNQDVFYYDWMIRDFLAFLIRYANGTLTMPGTLEKIGLGDEWLSRAQTAYAKAVSACENERINNKVLAGSDWQDIFGTDIPLCPP